MSHDNQEEGVFVPQGGVFPNPATDYGSRAAFEGMTSRGGAPGGLGALGGGRGGVDSGMVHVGQIVAPELAAAAEANRDLDIDHDKDVEAESEFGMTRARKDANRATSRDASRAPSHPAKDKKLPIPDSVRTPMTGRQQRVRNIAKNRAARRWTPSQVDTFHQVLRQRTTSPNSLWNRLNTGLERHHGSMVQLGKENPRLAQVGRRLDRAIRAGEEESGRTHVIYTNIVMPKGAPAGGKELTDWARERIKTGQIMSLDGYTIGAHNMHEICNPKGESASSVVFEIRTRRGIYIGGDERTGNTDHLLARGHRGRVVGVHQARYQRPDGTRGTRTVVQLEDLSLTEEAESQA